MLVFAKEILQQTILIAIPLLRCSVKGRLQQIIVLAPPRLKLFM